MNDSLTQRLNEVLPKVTSKEFLSSKGLGNELAFYIFDYPPEEELRIREHIQFLLAHIPKRRPGLRVKHVNLTRPLRRLLAVRSSQKSWYSFSPKSLSPRIKTWCLFPVLVALGHWFDLTTF